MKKILLIDGHSILARAFYGIPGLTTGDGRPTNAVFGFMNILLKAIQVQQPDFIAVAFDLSRKDLIRTQMYPAYKGTRKPMPEELHVQVPVMQDLLKAMNIPVVSLTGYEADDLLGTMARISEENGFDVTVLSGDRDLLQLATEHTTIMLPKTSRRNTEVFNYTPEDVKSEYKVTPTEFIDLKALMGDTSDNIPGLPGIGEVTAEKIITTYGSIENAKSHEDELKPPKIKQAFEQHYDLAVLSKKLATIDKSVPFEFDFMSGKADSIYTDKAIDLLRDLELKTLVSRFAENCSPNREEGTKSDIQKVPEFKLVSDEFMVQTIFHDALNLDEIGFHLYSSDQSDETYQLSLFEKEETGFLALGLALNDDRIYLIRSSREYPYSKMKKDLNSFLSQLSEKHIRLDLLDYKKSLHILPALYLNEAFDVGLAAYLINPLRSNHTYDTIARDLCGLILSTAEELLPKKADYSDAYIALNAWTAFHCTRPAIDKLTQDGMISLYESIELPLVRTLFDMEKAGIMVDTKKLDATGEKLSQEIKLLEQKIYMLAGCEFNINSPQQLATVLFETLGIPGGKKTKTGYSTSADILEKLAQDYEIVRIVLRYRQVSKLNSTYVAGLKPYINDDGRIHCTFNQRVTATGRLSCSDPNLQNIPVRTMEGRELRKVFVPQEGYTFVDADYSQVELRILASLSGDDELIRAYKESTDIHRLTASKVFHVNPEQVTDLQRRNAKAVNFGIVYGISAFGLGEDLSISRKEALEYIETYFKTYPGVKKYLDEQVRLARENGYVTTAFGRRRPVPELKSSAYMQRMFGERIAMNSPIQGTAADIMKAAMNKVAKRLENMKSRLVLQIHDELLVEASVDEVETVRQILKEEMEGAADLKVRLSVDVNTGKDWNECH